MPTQPPEPLSIDALKRAMEEYARICDERGFRAVASPREAVEDLQRRGAKFMRERESERVAESRVRWLMRNSEPKR